jgi:thiosulfate dehydrogenase
MKRKPADQSTLIKLVNTLVSVVVFVLFFLGLVAGSLIIGPSKIEAFFNSKETPIQSDNSQITSLNFWEAPDSTAIPTGKVGDEIRYGRELIIHTAEYLGPKGKVMAISNGMNCQNCHLEAGTKIYGNNYSAVASTYPKFRARSGTEETIEKRVNDCLERSLNGKALADDSREMRAIVAYIKWVGKDVPNGEAPKGVGLLDLSYLDTSADPDKGKILYDVKCAVCHGKNGEGISNATGTAWTYPPLWGDASYNDGAGLYRLSRFAGYIKANMPLGVTFDQPQLTDEECWHLAAYVNSLARPTMDKSMDWPDISKKPIDHPFGPFADDFTEVQHKFGPFKPIVDSRDKAVKGK